MYGKEGKISVAVASPRRMFAFLPGRSNPSHSGSWGSLPILGTLEFSLGSPDGPGNDLKQRWLYQNKALIIRLEGVFEIKNL